jgi:hypothetical protein
MFRCRPGVGDATGSAAAIQERRLAGCATGFERGNRRIAYAELFTSGATSLVALVRYGRCRGSRATRFSNPAFWRLAAGTIQRLFSYSKGIGT